MIYSLAFRTVKWAWAILGVLEGWIKGLQGFLEGSKLYSEARALGSGLTQEGN